MGVGVKGKEDRSVGKRNCKGRVLEKEERRGEWEVQRAKGKRRDKVKW